MSDEIRQGIRDYIIENLLGGDGRGFDDETDLQVTGILDSFDLIQLLAFIDETYDIPFDGAEIEPEDAQSVISLARLVERSRSRLATA